MPVEPQGGARWPDCTSVEVGGFIAEMARSARVWVRVRINCKDIHHLQGPFAI